MTDEKDLENLLDETILRLEALRIICEQAGVFSEQAFQEAIAALRARAADARRSAEAMATPQQRARWLAMLHAIDAPPQ